jgi:hypothetical protein
MRLEVSSSDGCEVELMFVFVTPTNPALNANRLDGKACMFPERLRRPDRESIREAALCLL